MSNYFVKLGLSLGYPQCCIDVFMQRKELCDMRIGTPLGNTGYIMCDSCKEKSYTEICREINARRDERLAEFPFYGVFTEARGLIITGR